MAHRDVPPLPCALTRWPGVSAHLLALSLAPPASGAALVAELAQLRDALNVQQLSFTTSTRMAGFFDGARAPAHRAWFLRNGGLAAVLAAAAVLKDTLECSNATCATAPLRLLRAGAPGTVSLTRDAATALLATAFLCLTPAQLNEFPTFCFRELWIKAELPSHAAKLDCHLHYFRLRATAPPPPGVLRFERRVLDAAAAAAEANAVAAPLCHLLVLPRASICASNAPLRVDFANMHLGGGTLRGGCVQEEILFSQRPELCVGCLLCEKMGDTEAIIMRGAACYSATAGYEDNFRWVGDAAAADAAPHDYVAFDAIKFFKPSSSPPRKGTVHLQWREDNLRRELRKALVAFAAPGGGRAPAVATGNWGCGAFNGNPHLKALLQWAAASIAQCDAMHYHVFGAEQGQLAPALEAAVQHVTSAWPANARTAGALCAAVARYAFRERKGQRQPPLLTWILSQDAREAANCWART